MCGSLAELRLRLSRQTVSLLAKSGFRICVVRGCPFALRLKENIRVANWRATNMVAAKNLCRTQKAGVGVLLRWHTRGLGRSGVCHGHEKLDGRIRDRGK